MFSGFRTPCARPSGRDNPFPLKQWTISALPVEAVPLNATAARVEAAEATENKPEATPVVVLMEGGKVPLGLQSRHTTGPGRGNRLPIHLVLNVSGGKNAGEVHAGGSGVGL